MGGPTAPATRQQYAVTTVWSNCGQPTVAVDTPGTGCPATVLEQLVTEQQRLAPEDRGSWGDEGGVVLVESAAVGAGVVASELVEGLLE